MKPTIETRSTLSSNLDSTSFHISKANEAAIMGMLRDGIYTDKVLAVLREYSANAWDAHKMVGKGDVPIKVTIPTRYDSTLRIRDYGPGLSHEDAFNIFCAYGNSTKRDTNDAVGMLGIGSKSGFAYSDTFTVISWHGGWKRTYNAFMDESEKGQFALLAETPCDPSETGVEIIIAVRSEDLYDFERKARDLYRHFSPRPEINISLPSEPAEQTVLTHGAIVKKGQYDNSEWIAIMGCVPYRVNLAQLDQSLVARCLSTLSGSLFFNIGDVQISTSREELKYSSATKAALVQKFNDLVDEYVMKALVDLEKPGVSEWDKRLKVQVLATMGLPLPEEYKDLAFQTAKVTYAPGTFVLLHNSTVTTRITVTSKTRLIIDDTGKKLDGYYLTPDDYVVRGENRTPADTQALLEQALTDSGLTGATIILLSTLSWNAGPVKQKKVVNPKHKARMFTLDATKNSFPSPLSDHWTTVDRIPEDTDVYLLISGFTSHERDSFFKEYLEDRKLAKEFGTTMPVIYGYKTSEKKPATGMKGVEYYTWRDTFITSLLTPDNLAKIQDHFWHKPQGDSDWFSWPDADESDGAKALAAALGDTHPICQMITRENAAKTNGLTELLADRAKVYYKDSEAGMAYKLITDSYPLLRGGNIVNLWKTWHNEPAHWIEYVQIVDERNANRKPALALVP